MLCHHQRFGNKLPTCLVWISWESCLIRYHLLQLQEIFIFRSLGDLQVQLGFYAFFRCVTWIQESILWSLVDWLAVPDRGLSSKAEESSSGGVLSTRQNLQVYKICFRSLSPKSMLWNDCSTKTWLFLIEAIRPLQYWSSTPSISCGSKEAEVMCLEHPVTISKGENLWAPKGSEI